MESFKQSQMKHYEKTEQKLAFRQIVQEVKDCCLSLAGMRLADRMRFMCSFDKVERELGLTDEFLSILLSNKAFPTEDYFDMSQELKRLETNGTFISLVSLVELFRSLTTIQSCFDFFERDIQDNYPLLKSLCTGLQIESEILSRCKRLLTSDGEMSDTASEELYAIRTNIRRTKSEIEKRLRKLLGISKQEGWTAPEAELTVRDGKGVIPISSANKRRMQGFIIDESSTGQTSYIEPAEVVELNNRLKEAEFEENREIIRILTEFTVFLRPFIPILLSAYAFLARIDFIRAKAKYALRIGAGKPILRKNKGFSWFEARHPILEASLKKNNKTIVPLKIELNDKKRILIISGPNAGGKSVCLKTVGLLQYMLQCGLLVPMKQTSECCLFDNLFIDIGDEQSLENDLSTYSSHLLSMKHLCRVANDACLFLIDECGTGTDPNIGGAIAEAVLEHLNDKNAFGIVTTHYSNLKLLSEKHSAISNAAMLFDTKALKPLYRLSVGNPGSSFAFEIAQTIGLPSEIIESAKTKVGSGMVDFEQSLQTLAVEKMEIKSKQTELQLADDLLNSLVEQYKAKKEEITRKEKEIIFEAKKQANQILKDANKQIEETIRNIKTTKAEKVSTQKEREKIKESIKKVEEESKALQSEISNIEPPKKETKKHIPFDNSPLQEGDIVLVDGQDSYGTVLKLKKNKAEVVCGQMSLSLPIEHLQKVNKNSYLKQQKQQSGAKSRISISLMQDINDLRAKFDYRLDLRGRRADEALSELSKYIDTARLLGESEIAILHGKGDGILKTVLRDYLKENPEVDSFKAERVEFGGEGITKIKLK